MPVKPSIVDAPLESKRIKYGETLELETTVEARPPAQFQWHHNGFELRDGRGGVHITSTGENHSKLQVENAVEGRYEVLAENTGGRCSAMTKLAVDYDTEPHKIQEQQQQQKEAVGGIKSPGIGKTEDILGKMTDIQKPEGTRPWGIL